MQSTGATATAVPTGAGTATALRSAASEQFNGVGGVEINMV